MADITVSLFLLALFVLISEVTRKIATKLLAKTDYGVYVVETISTFQLCACTHELKLLGEVGRIEPQIGLTLTYLISVIHALTFHGAIGNPSSAIEHFYCRRLTGKCVLARIACQFVGAVLARTMVPYVWALGFSDLHMRHKLFGFKCINPINATLPKGAAVELSCAFVVQTAVTHMYHVDEKYRAHAVAAVITALVYAGGSVTGAVFNPALAYSTQFSCSGHTFAEYSFVYWLGPVLGVATSLLLFDKIIPILSGKSSYQNNLNVPYFETKKLI
ncbi:aquaporin-11 [Anguilla anguilla]|uniref:Aquaporin n=1 Tax=Anguilla anguilla TaxID=7936 RepID=A0A9D3RNW5_ANGAN|nr:aquaporin-11 [Anguilla anguilla]KAG5837071.1 hypothetical protein ANANG_G00235370 [Anguilla anguilla]